MSSKAFKNYIRFVMSKHKISNYKVKYKIVINYPMTKKQFDNIANLENTDGLVDKETFYKTIETYGFLNNKRIIKHKDGEQKNEETYEIPGINTLNTDIPENITFELDDSIQKILNIPAKIEYTNTLKKINPIELGLKKRFTVLNSFMSERDWCNYIKSTYNKAYGLIDEEFLNNSTQVLKLPIYIKEECEYSNHAYKYTFGVLVYLEKDDKVCPICYSESRNPHAILDNFKITWDGVGVISLKDGT